MSSSVQLKNTYAAKQFMKAINQKLDTVESRLDKLIIKVAEETVKRVQDYILKEYYQTYPEGDNYDRLCMNGGFAGAIRYTYDSSTKQAKIIFDPSLLSHYKVGHSKYPHHIENGKNFDQGLYDYMMDGDWPSYKNNHIAIGQGFTGLNDGNKMDYEIEDWLNDYLTDRIRQEMEKQGFEYTGFSGVHS